ncbi:MAG: hypothetical protein ACREFR_05090, partial [Limisphaerales bacterium]
MKLPGAYFASAMGMAVFGQTGAGIHATLIVVCSVFLLGRRLSGAIAGPGRLRHIGCDIGQSGGAWIGGARQSFRRSVCSLGRVDVSGDLAALYYRSCSRDKNGDDEYRT